jgi:hypothetical protein
MTMNRREALQLLATGAALHLAPAKMFASLREARAVIAAQAASDPRTLNAHQAATVKTLVEMILPRTETPGAADVGASDFIDLMLTEWYEAPERQRFLSGLSDVDTRSQLLFGKDFVACAPPQQGAILTALGEQLTDEAQRRRGEIVVNQGLTAAESEGFYPMLRRLTLTAYYTSEEGATQELHFQVIPGRYDGCAEATIDNDGAQRQ